MPLYVPLQVTANTHLDVRTFVQETMYLTTISIMIGILRLVCEKIPTRNRIVCLKTSDQKD